MMKVEPAIQFFNDFIKPYWPRKLFFIVDKVHKQGTFCAFWPLLDAWSEQLYFKGMDKIGRVVSGFTFFDMVELKQCSVYIFM